MKPEQQRIAIAKACGWTSLEVLEDGVWGLNPEDVNYKGKRGFAIIHYEVPNYLNDLNAMHLAIIAQPVHVQWAIFTELTHVVSAEIPAYLGTAAQYAEAYLKTLNLWTD